MQIRAVPPRLETGWAPRSICRDGLRRRRPFELNRDGGGPFEGGEGMTDDAPLLCRSYLNGALFVSLRYLTARAIRRRCGARSASSLSGDGVAGGGTAGAGAGRAHAVRPALPQGRGGGAAVRASARPAHAARLGVPGHHQAVLRGCSARECQRGGIKAAACRLIHCCRRRLQRRHNASRRSPRSVFRRLE